MAAPERIAVHLRPVPATASEAAILEELESLKLLNYLKSHGLLGVSAAFKEPGDSDVHIADLFFDTPRQAKAAATIVGSFQFLNETVKAYLSPGLQGPRLKFQELLLIPTASHHSPAILSTQSSPTPVHGQPSPHSGKAAPILNHQGQRPQSSSELDVRYSAEQTVAIEPVPDGLPVEELVQELNRVLAELDASHRSDLKQGLQSCSPVLRDRRRNESFAYLNFRDAVEAKQAAILLSRNSVVFGQPIRALSKGAFTREVSKVSYVGLHWGLKQVDEAGYKWAGLLLCRYAFGLSSTITNEVGESINFIGLLVSGSYDYKQGQFLLSGCSLN